MEIFIETSNELNFKGFIFIHFGCTCKEVYNFCTSVAVKFNYTVIK